MTTNPFGGTKPNEHSEFFDRILPDEKQRQSLHIALLSCILQDRSNGETHFELVGFQWCVWTRGRQPNSELLRPRRRRCSFSKQTGFHLGIYGAWSSCEQQQC